MIYIKICNNKLPLEPVLGCFCYVYIIQGVTGGTDQTSEECSLGHTIPI